MTPPKTNEEAVKGGWRELKRQCEIRKLPFEDVKYLVTSTLSELVGEMQGILEARKKLGEGHFGSNCNINKTGGACWVDIEACLLLDLLSSLEQLKKKMGL